MTASILRTRSGIYESVLGEGDMSSSQFSGLHPWLEREAADTGTHPTACSHLLPFSSVRTTFHGPSPWPHITRAIRTRGTRHAAIAHLGQGAPALPPLRAGDVLDVNAAESSHRGLPTRSTITWYSGDPSSDTDFDELVYRRWVHVCRPHRDHVVADRRSRLARPRSRNRNQCHRVVAPGILLM